MKKNDEIHRFLLQSLFGKIENKYDAAINRAYRDFNRTLKDFFKENKDERKIKVKENWNLIIKQFINEVKNNTYENYEAFDAMLENYCKKLINSNIELYNKLTIGQAQKWLNMTLKYLIILEEDGIEINMQYFHIPIDNVIQDILEAKLNIPKEFSTWSQIDDYKAYLDYQQKVRTKFVSEYPILKEMELFNEAIAK
ncbi:MAG: hypothetical protein K1X55_12520 [Chitinophagales bacterium]|nr:hypothetical protein [Chitinophagales bacterium]